MVEYKGREGSQFKDDDARIIGPILLDLAKKAPNAILKPDMVLERARHRDCPLHRYFDWNDSEAAERWRLHQAGEIIRSVMVIVKDVSTDRPIRAFYNVRDVQDPPEGEQRNRGYVTLKEVLSNEEYRAQVIRAALSEVEGWSNRYRIYSELKPITKAIDDYVKEQREEEERERVKAQERAKA